MALPATSQTSGFGIRTDWDSTSPPLRILFAFSGNLKDAVILHWLLSLGNEVTCFVGDVGQVDCADFEEVKKIARAIGAQDVIVEDLKKDFVVNFLFPSLQTNAVYDGRYLLGSALSRPCLARRQVEIAKKLKCQAVGHGASNKGADQVRLELTYYALDPNIAVVAPWRDPQFLTLFPHGRDSFAFYAKEQNLPFMATDSHFSLDSNLFNHSHEGSELVDPSVRCPPTVYTFTKDPEKAAEEAEFVQIDFKDGIPIKATTLQDEKSVTDPVQLFTFLNELGSKHGVGRVDMVENRFIGIKSRGVYETPAGTILRTAHMDIEAVAMDREVAGLRDMFSPKFTELTYNGFWFSPEMDFLRAAINKSQEVIDGYVVLRLYRGNAVPIRRSSPSSLFAKTLSNLHIYAESLDPKDTEGYIKVTALRLKAHRAIMNDAQGLGLL